MASLVRNSPGELTATATEVTNLSGNSIPVSDLPWMSCYGTF
jgi:hypothetical protein